MSEGRTHPESGRAPSARLGILSVGVGLAVNPWSVGRLLADDGSLESGAARALLFALQGLCLLGGLLWMARPGLRRVPAALTGPLSLLALGVLLAGAYGSGRHVWDVALSRGWVQPHVATTRELCESLPRSEGLFLGLVELEQHAAALAAAEARGADDLELVKLRRAVARSSLQHGRETQAIALLESSLELALASAADPRTLNMVRRELGVAYLRSGEVEHCIDHHNPERCLFPIRDQGVWTDPSGALKAITQFELMLAEQPGQEDVRWLLNLAHMAVGTHPQGLAPEHLIAEETIASEDVGQLARMRDVAGSLGMDTFNVLGGVVLDDFDGDGLIDVLTSSYHPCESMLFFRNAGDGSFTDESTARGLDEQLGGFNLAHADSDNDGQLEVLVLRGAWMGPEFGRQRNGLLQLDADGRFSDVAEAAGLADVAYPCQAAAWADHDDDGDLDIYIGNESFPSELYDNLGDGRFVDIGVAAGVAGLDHTKGVSWGDFDNDGDMDVFESNFGQPNRLYRNDGGSRFTDVAVELGVAGESSAAKRQTFTSWFFDYDNDGWLDLFVGGYGERLSNVSADYVGLPVDDVRLALYRGDGAGGFVDVSADSGLSDVRFPMGANHGDVDNDGFLDIYLGTGSPPFEVLVPNRFYLNIEGQRFTDATTASGLGHLQKGHAVAFGDLDNDGDQDIFAQMGGFYPADAFHNAVFENPGQGNHWLTLGLTGVTSNRSAIGARITLEVEDADGNSRTIRAQVGSGASFGASSLQQEVGLGQATRVRSLEVWWPTSGLRQRFEDVALDQFVEIVEGQDELRVVARPVLPLGG